MKQHLPEDFTALPRCQMPTSQHPKSWLQRLNRHRRICAVGLVLFVALCGGLFGALHQALADCPSYVVRWGDTLNKIAVANHTDVKTLASLNSIRDVNRIYAGQRICIAASGRTVGDPLEWSTTSQVQTLLIQAADRHGLPRNLVLAVAWQESNWTQHVIARDGGVGTMQLMPYTTTWLNSAMHTSYNSYRLYDNIELGTSYLRMLWNSFGGKLESLISAYNQGENAVRTRGIRNWSYVNNVMALMRRFG
jgi:soluble lytic murein transglycosylase-like protein